MKQFRYRLEAALLHTAFFFFRLLPPSVSSDFGGFLGRKIGPRLAASRKARKHIEKSLDAPDTDTIVSDMWDNLGRVIAEYPHLKKLTSINFTKVSGIEHIKDIPHAVFFGTHLANWEVSGPSIFEQTGVLIHPVYRAPNNPFVAALLDGCRKTTDKTETIPKGRKGVRQLVSLLGRKENVGILIDQKYNEGVRVPFFGQDAMTSPAFVELAQKFNIPLIPIRVERLDRCQFRVTFYPAIPVRGREVTDVITDAHRLIESWIHERPGQWLWLHKRWVQ